MKKKDQVPRCRRGVYRSLIFVFSVICCLQHSQSFLVGRTIPPHQVTTKEEIGRIPHYVFLRMPTPNFSLQATGFFGGIFGEGDNAKKNEKDAVLATYDIEIPNDVDGETSNDADARFESLADYITNKWAQLFVTGNIPLTTPVRVLKGLDIDSDRTSLAADYDGSDSSPESSSTDRNSGAETVEAAVGCRLIFQKTDTGYKSKDEENEEESKSAAADNKSTSSEQEETKQGGVEILVELTKAIARQSLRVQARRCEIDDNTMIKEMSEDVIVKELQKAIDVWKKESVV